tara:strand:+ start:948 stop:1217 length:270 start_codon:yes stop_codon:yes gene_type:complete
MTNHEELSEQLHKAQMANKSYRNLPQRIMMQRWLDCGRDVYKFWDSIEWDSTWLRHDTEEEKYAKDVTREYNGHPFKKFIPKPKEYIDL